MQINKQKVMLDEKQQTILFEPSQTVNLVKNKFTFIDLYAGIGGFRIPLEEMGGVCLAFSEIDKTAIEVYKKNFNTSHELELGELLAITIPKSNKNTNLKYMNLDYNLPMKQKKLQTCI